MAFLSAVWKMFCSMHRLYTYVSDSTIYGRAILSSYGEILSGPIDFLILSVVMNLTTSCTAIGGMQKALAFRSLLWQNSFNVEEHSYSFRTSVSCLDEVSFSANEKSAC